MAISLEGYSAYSLGSPSGTQSITVPANTDFAVAVCGFYGDNNASPNNPVCSINSISFTQQAAKAVNESAAENGICIETLVNPATGSQTLAYDWGFDPFDNQEIVIAYFSGVDATTPVASAATSNTCCVSGLTAADMMVGGAVEYTTIPTVTGHGQTKIADANTGSNGTAMAYQAGAETYFDSSATNWQSAAAITLNEASGGTPVSNTAMTPIEALGSPSGSSLASFEALAQLSNPSALPLEALASTTQTAMPRFEALHSVEQLLATEYEALAQALALTPIHYEALGQAAVVSLADLAIECLGRALQSTWTHYEARQTINAPQSALYESLASRSKADTFAVEALQQVARSHALPLESLGQAIYAATLNLEALGEAIISALAEIDFEALAVAIVPRYFGVEALSGASSDALIVIESAQTAALDLSPHFEAVQRIQDATVLSVEALAALRINRQGQTESLATVLAEALDPIEALKEIIRAHALPFEADGANLVLVTPHWRIYTVGREIRVISISATRD